MGKKCSQGVEIGMCNLGLPGGHYVRCTQKRNMYLWKKFGVEMFPEGKPDDIGPCDDSKSYGMTRKILNAWTKKVRTYQLD